MAKEKIKIELRPGHTMLEKDTKVMATKTGYSDSIREIGDVFYVKKGTIMGPECWFEPVDAGVATTEQSADYEDLSAADLKVRLNKLKIDITGITKKSDLVALLIKAEAEGGEDLA